MTAILLPGPSTVRWLAAVISTPPTDPLGPVSQNPDEVRDAACRLVESRSVCSPPAPPPSVVPHSPETANGGALGLLLWVLLLAVVVAIAYVGYRYLAGRRGTRSAEDDGDEVDPDDDALAGMVIIDRSREPGDWRQEAEGHRTAGRHREALRCRYRALVGDLARRGLLDEIPGRTTGEERNELLVSAPSASPFFRDAADLFDAAWYGHVAVGAGDDDRFQRLDHDVLANAIALRHRVPRTYETSAR